MLKGSGGQKWTKWWQKSTSRQ